MTPSEIDALYSIPTYRCPTRRTPVAKDGISSTVPADDARSACVGPRGDYTFVAHCYSLEIINALGSTPVNYTNLNPLHFGCPGDWSGNLGTTAAIEYMRSAMRPPMNPHTAQWYPRDTFARITDGTSNTIIFGEKHVHIDNFQKWGDSTAAAGPPWYIDNGFDQDVAYTHSPNIGSPYGHGNMWNGRTFIRGNNAIALARGPYDRPQDLSENAGFGSWHPMICNFLFVDGSVRALSNAVTTGSINTSATAANGQDFIGSWGILWMLADAMDGCVVSP